MKKSLQAAAVAQRILDDFEKLEKERNRELRAWVLEQDAAQKQARRHEKLIKKQNMEHRRYVLDCPLFPEI